MKLFKILPVLVLTMLLPCFVSAQNIETSAGESVETGIENADVFNDEMINEEILNEEIFNDEGYAEDDMEYYNDEALENDELVGNEEIIVNEEVFGKINEELSEDEADMVEINAETK